MFEDLLNAFQNFRINKIRTILSLLGVIIGVASVIVITTISASASRNIQDSFGSSGLDLVRMNTGFMRRMRDFTFAMDDEFRTELISEVPHIKKIYYNNTTSAALRYGVTDVNCSVVSIEYGYLEASHIQLDYGDFFNVSDSVHGTQKIIIGAEIASMLFPEGDAVGKTVTLDASDVRFAFSIIGVLKEQNSAYEDPSRTAYIPRAFYLKKIDPFADASWAIAAVDDQNYAVETAELIASYAEKKSGSEYALSVFSMQTILEQYNDVTQTTSAMLSGVAAISLLVGGIGIMNIMIVAVTERRREIGIRKALGASPSVIRRQFLVESAAITLTGGFIGVLAGAGISAVVVFVMDLPFVIQWQSSCLAFVSSAFLGIFFGLSPAARAAKLSPVEALSFE